MSVRVPTFFPLIGCSGNKTVQLVNICSSAQSILPHAEFRCYEAKIKESERLTFAGSPTEDTSGLSCQCSATEVTAGLSLFLISSKVTYLLLSFPICPPM